MVAGASNGSNGWRLLSASVAVASLAALTGAAGCGTSNQGNGGSPDAGHPIGMIETVMTGGGGAATSSGGGSLFTMIAQDASAEASSPVTDGAPADAIASSGGSSDGGDGEAPSTCVDYQAPTCGIGATCDLRYNTCCANPTTLTARCVAKPQPCEQEEAPVACVQACECPTGQVCCGYYYQLMGAVGSGCQTVGQGGACQPSPQTNTQAAAQLCGTQGECVEGDCINQTCVDDVTLNVCGLQSQAPFFCEANDAGI
jgi:hypothetical protein